jgi:hypothetical protein
MLGVAEAEFAVRLTSTEQGSEADPHVLLALQIDAGFGSEQAYLLFCAWIVSANRTSGIANKVHRIAKCRRNLIAYLAWIVITTPAVESC